jgi:putative membrane protein
MHLPTLNAFLNSTSVVLLVLGYVFIKKKNITAHRLCMLLAVLTSMAFLVSYLYYHYHAGSKRFEGIGWVRPVYFSVLITHTVLAASIVPLVIASLWRAWGKNFEAHKRIARWTWPIWMYVSVTGVVIYLMLYR